VRLFCAAAALVPCAALLPAAPALAQANPVTVGTQVVDVKGGLVGTVSAIKGDMLTVKTNRFEVALPWSSFNINKGKLLFGLTQAELNAATERTLAEAAAQMSLGAIVKGSDGVRIGTLESVNADVATIRLDSGQRIEVPRTGVVAGSDGIVIGVTAAQLEAQLGTQPVQSQ
jgi:preprotein translocase subunit YajC